MAPRITSNAKQKDTMSIRLNIILVISLILLCITGALVYANYRDAFTLVKETAITRAVQVRDYLNDHLRLEEQAEIDALLTMANSGDGTSKSYMAIKNTVEAAQGVTGAKFVYISVKLASSDWVYFADGYQEGNELYTPLGTPIEEDYYDLYKELEASGEDLPGEYENASFGRLMSSYFPIKDSSGEVVAILGTDFDIEANYQFFIKRFWWSSLTALLLMLVAIIIVDFFINSWIVKPLKKMLGITEEIAQGNLKQELPSIGRGEVLSLSWAIQSMQSQLRVVVSHIQQAASQVADGSHQLSDASLTLSQGANDQAHASEQIVNTLETLETSARKSTEHAEMGHGRTLTVLKHVKKGRESSNSVLKTMQSLEKSAKELQRINKVIDDLAFQTHILALNASVEAARAGEAGKSFSVVAEEVQNLASRSSKSSKETAALIESVFNQAGLGLDQSIKMEQDFHEIAVEIEALKHESLEIQDLNHRQKTDVERMSEHLKRITDSIRTTSATAEESAAASEELSSQATLLNNETHKFSL